MYVVITGASRGIGKSFAYLYAKNGYDLILTCEKNIVFLNNIKNDIENLYGRTVIIKKGLLDYGDLPEDIYILINNAGKCDYNLFQDISYEKYKEIIYSNLDYTFLTTQLVLKKMIKRRQGIIVNISSMWGIIGASLETVYSMTKGGINALTKSLSKEVFDLEIDVVAFAIGAVDTEMNEHLDMEERTDFLKKLENGKMFTADEITNKIYNILNNKKYKSGEIIEINNGLK